MRLRSNCAPILACCHIIFLACASLAQASMTITSATLNGASSVNVTPGASITAVVNETNTSGSTWGSTQWNISGNNCVDTPDHITNGSFSESFTITAPNAPGTYTVTFTAFKNDNCGSSSSNTLTLTNSIVVCTAPTAPTSASVDHNNFCSGAFANIALTATGGSGTTLGWYTGSC